MQTVFTILVFAIILGGMITFVISIFSDSKKVIRKIQELQEEKNNRLKSDSRNNAAEVRRQELPDGAHVAASHSKY